MIDILGKTHFRSTSGETSDKKSTQKIFYCTKRFVIEFQGESLELFLSYLVYFRRYRHFRPSRLKKRLKSTQLLINSNISGELKSLINTLRILRILKLDYLNKIFYWTAKWLFASERAESADSGANLSRLPLISHRESIYTHIPLYSLYIFFLIV